MTAWKRRWGDLRRSAFFKDSLAYTGANIPAQAAAFLSGLVLRRIFPPAVMGYWSLRGVAQRVLGTFDLGAEIGASRELPLLAGRGEELRLCRSTAFWFACLQSVTITLAWVAWLAMRRSRYSLLEFSAMIVSGALFILGDLEAIYVVFFRSGQAYRPLSRVFLLSTLGESVLIPAAAWLGGLPAVFAAAVLAAAGRLAYISWAAAKEDLGVSLDFSRPLMLKLVNYGARMRVVDYPFSTSLILPQVCVAKLMGLESLALFSLAWALAGQVGDVSTRVSTVFVTRFLGLAGKGQPVEALVKELRGFLNIQLLVVVPLFCWAGGLLLPLALHFFIPKYDPAMRSLQILLVSTFFLVNNSGLYVPWISSGRLLPWGLANLAGLVFMASSLAVVWLVLRDRTIEGVAWGCVFGSAGYFGAMLFAAGRDLWPFPVSLAIFLSVAAAAAWTACVLSFMADAASLATAGWRGALGLAALLPVAVYGLRRSELI